MVAAIVNKTQHITCWLQPKLTPQWNMSWFKMQIIQHWSVFLTTYFLAYHPICRRTHTGRTWHCPWEDEWEYYIGVRGPKNSPPLHNSICRLVLMLFLCSPQDVFTISVGNLPSGATVLIKVTFVSELIVRDGSILFSLPGSVAPWQESAALNQTTQVRRAWIEGVTKSKCNPTSKYYFLFCSLSIVW